ncbi:MAG TPA: hypothetical protein VG709_00135 [Actinomycetota bacterium]|nr:hypothetical protein [Actinomycetota bacterium]
MGDASGDAAVVREAHERLARGDLEGFAELVADDATWVGVTPEDGAEPATCANRQGIVETLRQNLQASLHGELARIVQGTDGLDGRVGDWFHSIETRAGRIARMRDAVTWAEALVAAGASDG